MRVKKALHQLVYAELVLGIGVSGVSFLSQKAKLVELYDGLLYGLRTSW